MLEKIYNPEDIEKSHYSEWERSGAFACGKKASAQPFTIVIPPPNVTGSLHMGHALNNTLQDILVRYKRMNGYDVLWQPGTDHAGIATQMVVERNLAEGGESRHDLGREAFIKKVWEWKQESGGNITNQLRRLGASCDWGRERFTMDEGLSKAVRKVFVDLHGKGLIYRDKRLVNWDPKLQTAISDLEVEQRDCNGKMWYFKYPLESETNQYLIIGTTRPETMLGDSGIAVHPEDNRYKNLIGKRCILPIVNRKLEIVADNYADPEKGSGAVKITPAHDFNDFDVGKRHNLKMINIFNSNAHLNENVPKKYRGLDRFDAREAIISEMDSLGLIEKIEENPMTLPYGDRSGVIIEPWLMDQWFVDAKALAGSAITAVERGDTKFVPPQWQNTYFEWMRNIQPWCVSRQIWWGHQIPAWFGPDNEIFVELTEKEASAAAQKFYGREVELTQDPDVLDTWFSSALWPFSTLGWPSSSEDVSRYYPTDVLVTGFDIIFFWVARMMMMGLEFMHKIPFHTVYIHALVRDENGQKMSKSKGNVIDPLDLIDDYGADALRFTLTAFAAQGRDVKLSSARVEGYRNFCTKLWNAARFCEMNKCKYEDDFDPLRVKLSPNKWILSKLCETEQNIKMALENYRFNDFANSVYQFTRNIFCDWYIEFAKPYLQGEDAGGKVETRETLGWVLDCILKIMHPITPFITEELWQKIGPKRETPLVLSNWPRLTKKLANKDIEVEIDWVISLISYIRGLRAELNVPTSAVLQANFKNPGNREMGFLEGHRGVIFKLAKVSSLEQIRGETPRGSIESVIGNITMVLSLAEVVDIPAEKIRIKKELSIELNEINRLKAKLENQKFIENAPESVVNKERIKLQDVEEKLLRLQEVENRLFSIK